MTCNTLMYSEGAIDILTPFLTFQHFQSLPATMTIAFLGGRQEEGVVTDLLSSLPDIVDKLTDLLDNTVHKKGGKEYDSGVSTLLLIHIRYYMLYICYCTNICIVLCSYLIWIRFYEHVVMYQPQMLTKCAWRLHK
jgi:hypothetical protein